MEPRDVPPLGAPPALTRRQVLRSGLAGTVGLLAAQALVGGGIMLWPARAEGFGTRLLAPVTADQLAVGGPPVRVRAGKFYLVRVPAGVMALYWKCAHLGCTVPWNQDEGVFHCPCHNSRYALTGELVGGPAPRPLDIMAVELEGRNIWVDTGRITERERYHPSQATPVPPL